MAVPFPAWLDTNPSGEFQAAEAGARMGLQAQAIQERGAAAAAADQARQLQAQTRAQAMEYSAKLASHDREMKLQEAQLANDNSQKMALIGLQQQELNMKIQQAQQKYQANQTYQQLTANGVDPIDAALQVGPGLLGDSTGGLASMMKAGDTTGFTPRNITIPDTGISMIETSPNHFVQAKLPTEWQVVTADDGTQVQENKQTHERKALPGVMTESQRENLDIRKQNKKLTIINSVKDEDIKDALESGTGIDKAWSDRKKKQYAAVKKQLDGVDSSSAQVPSSGAQFKYNPDTNQLEPVDQAPQADTE